MLCNFCLIFYNRHLGILFFRMQTVVKLLINFIFEPFRRYSTSAEKVIVTAAFAIFEVLTRFCRVQNDFYAIKLFLYHRITSTTKLVILDLCPP